jgi:benzoate membrane transport protein
VAWTVPAFNLGAIVGIALPLFLVTMVGQNVPAPPSCPATGARRPAPRTGHDRSGQRRRHPFGGHQVNLAAITAVLTAGPEAHPDPRRRWIATLPLAGGQVLLGLGAGVATALVLLSPRCW